MHPEKKERMIIVLVKVEGFTADQNELSLLQEEKRQRVLHNWRIMCEVSLDEPRVSCA